MYKAAVIGCGRIGAIFDDSHAGAYVACPNVHLFAVCDNEYSKAINAANKWDNIGTFGDYLEMIRWPPDIVSVCTPPDTHSEIVCNLANSGRVRKAIFCEKPIATTLEEAQLMIDACKQNNIFLVINHQRRFSPFHQEIARFIQQGELGRIQQVTCYYTAGLFNTGSHLIDLLRFYFDTEIAEATGWYSKNESGKVDDPNIDGCICLADGTLVVIQACDVSAYAIFEVNILGMLGRLRIVDSGYNVVFELALPSNRFGGYFELSPMPVPFDEDRSISLLNGVNHIVDCLDLGLDTLSSGEDGMKALEVLLALKDSAERGGVTWN